MSTIYLSEAAFKRADKVARGKYQTALLRSGQSWSGADLRGRARDYARKYAESRDNLLSRLEESGLGVQMVSLKHGRKTVLIGDDPSMVRDIAVQLSDPETKVGAQAALRLLGIDVEV